MRSTRLKYATAGIAVMVVAGIAAFGALRADQQQPAEGVSSLGAQLFNDRCAFCHPRDTVQGAMGPGLVGLFSREALPASGRPVTEANILRQLNDPMGSMPTFAWMEEWEKDAVVAYLKTL